MKSSIALAALSLGLLVPFATLRVQAQSPDNLPLRGLGNPPINGTASLLVTPGAHPVGVKQPLTRVLDSGVVTAKIDSANLPRGKFQGLQISVQNNSDRPLLFDGDAATAVSPVSCVSTGGTLPCVSLARLAELSVLPEQSKSFGKRFITDLKATTSATVTVGWAQALRDQKVGSGPIVDAKGGRYGVDEQRRQDEYRRFGKRVLWPGDATSGVIYFDRTKDPIRTISLPVSSYYDRDDRGSMSLHQ